MLNLKAFEAELTRLTIFWTAMEVIAWILLLWALYHVVKAAVRDGINESRLGERAPRAHRTTELKDLPPMHADR